MSSNDTLAARRRLLAAQCAEQRAMMAHDVALLRHPADMGGAPAFVAQHKTSLLAAAGLGLGFLVTKPKWVVGVATGALSAYKLAQKVLPVLGWRKFEVH
ncbi:hypothetical protein ACFOHT_12115 [Massilia oculi]|jgi:hypothetical protein|uniref:Uncharacterized protein n=1 Tax=Massilia oculi TaxID=945844 RepID=A0A2S2DGW7_9BURK|nr:hypothetical protein [Massilia oculi]AWL04633.1 hypothetical protein DIR46_09410 [Massilia oculi]